MRSGSQAPGTTFPGRPGWAWLSGIALLSCGGLVLEIALTRVLSVAYFYSQVYVLLSVAVLGIGLGAALASLHPAWRARHRLPAWAALAGFSSIGLALLATAATGWSPRLVPLLGVLVPYLFLGLSLATAFASRARWSPSIYGADLCGAGVGALASVPLLDALGGPGGMLAAAAMLSLAGLLLGEGRRHFPAICICGLAAAALLGNLWLGWPKVDLARLAAPKPAREQVRAGARLIATRWDAFARSDLLYRPDQDATYLYLDGAAGSLVPAADRAERWMRDIGRFPFVSDPVGSALIIGPGGGLDVALARAAGVEDITAVELNRAGVELVRGLGAYTGNVYDAGVTLLFDEGRSALRRMDRSFDLILLSQVVTQAAGLRGYALTENALYTVEAVNDYLDHLSPGGQIAIKLYDELTLTRALTTAVRALSSHGLSEAEAARHLTALLDTRASPPIPLLLIRKQPIDGPTAVRLARTARDLDLTPLYLPGRLVRPPLDGLLQGRTQLEDIVRNSTDADLRPTTDRWPFFYEFQPGLPDRLKPLSYGLLALLALGLVLLGVTAKRRARVPARVPPLLFAALGFGFMAAEVGVLQKVQLFLGHPTLTLAIVLGTLLLGGGLGSAALQLLPRREPAPLIALACLLVLVCLAIWVALWAPASAGFPALGPGPRSLLVGLGLAPLALLLGMPFPLALRALAPGGAPQVTLAWAVNGVMSVAGGVGATVLAVLFGYDSVALASGAAYLAAAGLAVFAHLGARSVRQVTAP